MIKKIFINKQIKRYYLIKYVSQINGVNKTIYTAPVNIKTEDLPVV